MQASESSGSSGAGSVTIVSTSSDAAIKKRVHDEATNTTTLSLQWRIPRFEALYRTGQTSGLTINFKTPIFTSDEDENLRWYVIMVPTGNVSVVPAVSLNPNLQSTSRQGFYNLILTLILDLSSECSRVTATFDCQNRAHYLFLSSPFLRTDVIKQDLCPSRNRNCITGLVLRVPAQSNGDVIIQCNLKTENVDSFTKRDIVALNDLSDNLANLYGNSDLSDVVITVQGQKIPACKAILAARSPVLAALFRTKMTESAENEIVISDADPDAFKEFVYYLYTGKTTKITEMADQLLILADKYDVVHLRQLSQTILKKKLAVDSVLSLLVLAELHSAKELKAEAIKFVNLHWETVSTLEQWKDFIVTYPLLLNEIFLESKKDK